MALQDSGLPDSPKATKHLSQPYTHNMHSMSTESLPTLFGATSLRRTHSNVVSKTRPTKGSASLTSSTPASPIASGGVSASSTSPSPSPSSLRANSNSSYHNGSLPSHSTIPSSPGSRSGPTGSSGPSVSIASEPVPTFSKAKEHLSTSVGSLTATAQTGPATGPRRPNIDVIPEHSSELNESHRRRPSSWDIMDMLAIDQLRQWMVCFSIESVYPPSDFTPEERKNICFSSFPDSNTFDVGDTVFNFRIRSTTAGRAATGPTTDAGFLYGYVFFRQKQDPSIRRGYFQKSVVLLSQHPFIGLFSKLVSALGPAYFEVGKPMLETAFHDMARWRPPVTDTMMELPFMGTLYQVQIAKPHRPQLLETTPFEIATFHPDTHILSSVPMNGGLYKHFQDLVPDLWLCWELMTLAEPIMLIGTSPEVCSESVASLVDLINPIPYCGDYRPYFTIQDTDFKSFCNKSSPPSSIVLGVTNPFFIKTLEHWPHIIKIGKPMNRRPNSKLTDGKSVNGINGGNRHGTHKPSSLDFVQGLVSKRKGAIQKDTNILCMLAEATANRSSPGYLLDNILRKHFATLTERFLVPLNRYFATLVPNDISLSSTSQFPHIAPFKQQTFLKFLSKNPPAISFKTSAFKSNSDACQSFYKDFLKCGNFATWLRLRTIAAQNELRRRYLEILSLGDITGWVKGRNEVELVDLLVRMREELGTSGLKTDLFCGFKSKIRNRPGLVRAGSSTSVQSQQDSAFILEDHRRYSDGTEGPHAAGSGSGSENDSRTLTPPPSDSTLKNGTNKPLPSTPRNIPLHHPSARHAAASPFSNASSFSSASSRAATPSRSSSSSSLNVGWTDIMDEESAGERGESRSTVRESSEERQRKRFAPEASQIKASAKQKEHLRDQIRLLIEALPVDLRESLQAHEDKKSGMRS
ncbi:Protein dennd6a [Gryganskiella cystojenkinii]|nr:Protein dennd6a [Gryganskiella cystojenkinii]